MEYKDMTVQDLIDELSKIKDKTKIVIYKNNFSRCTVNETIVEVEEIEDYIFNDDKKDKVILIS